LEQWHRLTTSNLYELRFDMEDYAGLIKYAHYSHVLLSNEAENYAMDVGDYTGTAGKALVTSPSEGFLNTLKWSSLNMLCF